ncbi:hypothetical protein M427DRAFT_57657 [Gonapodya prolifera JEL478]|uniref:Uncharacterized protein n=1 Tax=Gonapodya prolifera (strain JEL478) TaxID=1344416 RepID=A0A139ACL4_GONPJ|nr:hypothetical protein M427DRAFT_57657 [Gonapodya prolifera JEL478]|eukprot:KXS14488.1 hypothetical protein M427DRAFT_57657 [Gonapodya prolifera JEL478]
MKLTNIHPVTKPAQDTMTLITMVLILVASILSANFIAKIKVPSDRIRQGILRLYFAIPFMLVLSFVINGAPFALGSTQGNFARVWFWWFYVGLTSLSFVSMLFTLLGNKIGQGIVMLFLYVFITSSGGLTEMLITPDFYRIGYALFPFFASQQHLLYRDALVILAWFVFCIVVQSVAYIRGVNERVGQKMNTRAARKIEVPEKLGKQPLKFLKRVVSTDLDVPDLLAKS